MKKFYLLLSFMLISVIGIAQPTSNGDANNPPASGSYIGPPGPGNASGDNEPGQSTTGTTVSGPTAAPAAPTKDAANVISVYSDSYTSIYTDLAPNGGDTQTTVVSEVDYSGNMVLKYLELNFQGLDYTPTDVSSMEYLHIDYFTVNSTALSIWLWDPNKGDGQPLPPGVTLWFDIAVEVGITQGEWVSLDIPLTHYTISLSDVNDIYTNGNGTVFFDNIYFWKEETLSNAENISTTFEVYPNPASNFLTINSPLEISFVKIFDMGGREVMESEMNNTSKLDISTLNKGIYLLVVNGENKTDVLKFTKE